MRTTPSSKLSSRSVCSLMREPGVSRMRRTARSGHAKAASTWDEQSHCCYSSGARSVRRLQQLKLAGAGRVGRKNKFYSGLSQRPTDGRDDDQSRSRAVGRSVMFRPYMGQIISVGFDFAPSGWMKCQGQLLPIDQYDALFSLLGTTYGGDGQTTFALPDLQGRAALSMGQGPNLSNYVIADNGGDETVTLTSQQAPPHQHAVYVLPIPATRNVPTDPTQGSLFLTNEGPAGATLVYTYAPYRSE